MTIPPPPDEVVDRFLARHSKTLLAAIERVTENKPEGVRDDDR